MLFRSGLDIKLPTKTGGTKVSTNGLASKSGSAKATAKAIDEIETKTIDKPFKHTASAGDAGHKFSAKSGSYVDSGAKKPVKFIEETKPSAGLSKTQKSNVVKSAKAGEDIGKKGKGFNTVAKKAAKEYGSKEKGEKVAAAAMWKNVKREGKTVNESEVKVKKYIRAKLEELAGLRKPSLNESTKSSTLKKLDEMIVKEYNKVGKK